MYTRMHKPAEERAEGGEEEERTRRRKWRGRALEKETVPRISKARWHRALVAGKRVKLP